MQRYYSQLTRFSAAFAFLADISLLVLGGALKRKERLSARLGDILSMLYLCSAVLKRFKDDGAPQLIYRCCIGPFRMRFIACSRHSTACWIIFLDALLHAAVLRFRGVSFGQAILSAVGQIGPSKSPS